MKTLSFLFALVSYVSCLQFEDDAANVEQAKQGGFFPSSEDERYSQLSGISYVAPQQPSFDDPPNDNRKQLNFNDNPIRYTPPGGSQYYQANPYRPPAPQAPLVNINVVRKRPSKQPYQFVGQPSSSYNSYPSDLSNPFYQNYANRYQYPSAQYPTAQYPNYYNPTRYPSATSVNAQPQILHQPTHQYPSYYTNNYANQFGYQRPTHEGNGVGGGSTSGIANFFNNLRESTGSFGQLSQAGSQFSKALEDISENDDLQCVPKILCQMVGSQRPSRLPAIMNAPGISAIISALPSTSPLMNFGRAALLGLSGRGDCDSAYPKCPRDEEQMLLYLNNHRGGFFRFFNGGNSFGDETNLQQYQQQQDQQYNQQPAAAEQGLNLLALQALADTLNSQGSGINLSNLFSSPSNQRPAVQNYPQPPQPTQSSGLFGMFKGNMFTDIVSNLLTGVVGNRFSRRISKRSLPDEDTVPEGQHQIEKRIVNLKANVIEAEPNFFEGSSSDQQQNTLYSLEEPFTFSNGNRIKESPAHLSLKFPAHQVSPQEVPLSEINQGNFISPSDIARRLKSLFPEAAGHLRFDNDQFNRELLKALVNDRIGKILTGVQQQQQRPINSNYGGTRYQGSYNSNFNYPAQKPNYAGVGSASYNNFNTNHINRGQQSSGSNADRSHIVYVTDSRGQIEYTLDEKTGQKQRY